MNKEENKVLVDKDAIDSMADNIEIIAASMRILAASRLKRTTITSLIQIKTGLPKKTIDKVLNSIENLEKDFLK